MRRAAGAALIAAALAGAGGGAPAAECRLALALGLDTSSSVDPREYKLQTRGLAAALTAPDVVAAFLAEPEAPVRLMVYEWSGWQQQVVRQDWMTIAGPDDLAVVAAALAAMPRNFVQFPTALGMALLYGGRRLEDQPACDRRTLDIAGDGTNNDGVSPELARRDGLLAGITVNGLVVGSNAAALARYYRQSVVQGPGAFVEEAEDYADFERAMRRKLLRELEGPQISRLERPAAPPPARGSRRSW